MADTYFFLVLAIAITEMVLSGFWNRLYFTIGIPVFRKRIPVRLTEVPTPDQLAVAMKTRWSTPLIFHKFQNGEVGFRERVFGGGFFHYTPIMHGIIREDSAEPVVVVVGLLNWFVLAFAMFVAVALGEDALEFGGFLAAGIALLYLLQRRRFNKVAAAVSNKPAV
jgi:hypothetical protein